MALRDASSAMLTQGTRANSFFTPCHTSQSMNWQNPRNKRYVVMKQGMNPRGATEGRMLLPQWSNRRRWCRPFL